NRRDRLGGRAKIGKESAKRLWIRNGEHFSIVIARDGHNLAGIVDVGLIELRPVLLILVGPINYVAQVKEERGTGGWLRCIEIGCHGSSNGALGGVRAFAGIAHAMKFDGWRGSDFLTPLAANDVGECHRGISRWRGNRLYVALDVIEKPFSDPRY